MSLFLPLPIHARRRALLPFALRAESAFSLVEAIVAMLIVSVVATAAAVAVTSTNSSETRMRAVADHHAIAERALEQLSGDLSQRTTCEQGAAGWRAASRQALLSGTTTAANLAPCTVRYPAMVSDEQGRRYDVEMEVDPIDLPADGLGVDDADRSLRDDYLVTTKVQLAQDSKAGLEKLEPVVLSGSVDWSVGAVDLGSVRVNVCGLDRPERSTLAANCATGDAGREPLAGVSVSLVPVVTGSGTVVPPKVSPANGSIDLTAAVLPGMYRVEVSLPNGLKDDWQSLPTIDPTTLDVQSGGRYEVNVSFSRKPTSVQVCSQLVNKPDPDYGHAITETNLFYRRTGSPAYRSVRIELNENTYEWKCVDGGVSGALYDPLQYGPNDALYRGVYDLEVEQVKHRTEPSIWGLKVVGASLNCSTGLAISSPLDGVAIPDRPVDPVNERPPTQNASAESWYGRMDITQSGAQMVCLRFESYPFAVSDCTVGTTPGCVQVGSECTQYCPDGEDVCVAYCDEASSETPPPPAGTAGTAFSYSTVGNNLTQQGGPNDPYVACATSRSVTYKNINSWFAFEDVGGYNDQFTYVHNSRWAGKDWVGGNTYYTTVFQGEHAALINHPWTVAPASDYPLDQRSDRPLYYCDEIAFTGGEQTVRERFPFWSCIEAWVPGRPYKVRGRMLDGFGENTGHKLGMSIAAWAALAPESPGPRDYWNASGGRDYDPGVVPLPTAGQAMFSSPNRWADGAVQARRIYGDPVCNLGGGPDPEPVYERRDPVFTPINILKPPQITVVPAPNPPTNVNSSADRSAV